MSALTNEDRETLLCDCDVALADDSCPVHAEDAMNLWTEKPAADIEAAVEQIIARHVAAALTAKADEIEAAFAAWDSLGVKGAPHKPHTAEWLVERAYHDAARIVRPT